MFLNQINPIQVAQLKGLQDKDIKVIDTVDQEGFKQLQGSSNAWKNQNHSKGKLGMPTCTNCKSTYAQTHYVI